MELSSSLIAQVGGWDANPNRESVALECAFDADESFYYETF